MQIDIKGVHYHVSDNTKDFIDKKMHKLDFAKDYIVKLNFTITKDPNGFSTEANISLKWGVSSHVKVESHELWEALELLIDKLLIKIKKEKDKVQDHKVQPPEM